MANRKKRKPQVVVEPKKIEVDIEAVQAQTLTSLEALLAQAPELYGVSIAQCCMYDIIQMVNGVFAREIAK